eukprot:scaffold12299_cov58-Phaeocystis_antarctica.AAC.6
MRCVTVRACASRAACSLPLSVSSPFSCRAILPVSRRMRSTCSSKVPGSPCRMSSSDGAGAGAAASADGPAAVVATRADALPQSCGGRSGGLAAGPPLESRVGGVAGIGEGRAAGVVAHGLPLELGGLKGGEEEGGNFGAALSGLRGCRPRIPGRSCRCRFSAISRSCPAVASKCKAGVGESRDGRAKGHTSSSRQP